MIRLAKPRISDHAIKQVTEVLRSGNLVQGEKVSQFENTLEQYLGVKHAVAVSSGTAALHISLLSLNIGPGDEVIIPAFTYPATANAVEIVGAKPVFVDINLDDFCINTKKIEEVITKNTAAVMPVHEFGQPAKMDDIISLCEKHNLLLIEDAACALGTSFDSKKAGTFGDFGCFSFHPRKAITTGEGGLIVSDNNEFAKTARILRNHGILMENNKMNYVAAGLNYRMTEFQAVIGIDQLQKFDEDIEYKIELAKVYDEKLADFQWISVPKLFEHRKMVYQTYHIIVNDNIDRDNLIKHLKKNNIETNFGAQALNCTAYFSEKYDLNKESNPNASIAYHKGVALPIGSHINYNDIEYIVQVIKKFQTD